MANGQPWSLKEDRMLVRLRCEGLERDLIAEALNRPPTAVSGRTYRLKELGVLESTRFKGRGYRLCDDGMQRLEDWHQREETGNGLRHGAALKDRVADLWNDGMGHREIAATLGRSRSTAGKLLADLRDEGEIGYVARPWTQDELDALASAAPGDEARLAVRLGRTAHAVLNKLRNIRREAVAA